jgi:hypothetical protein
MAAGDCKFFAAYVEKALAGGGPNLSSDAIKVALVTGVTPAITTADPRWGSGGTTNFSTAQVATGTAYPGPISATSVVWTRTGASIKFDFADPLIAKDTSGFTNATFAIVYDDTAAGKPCIGFIDLGTARSIVDGALSIELNVAGFGSVVSS